MAITLIRGKPTKRRRGAGPRRAAAISLCALTAALVAGAFAPAAAAGREARAPTLRPPVDAAVLEPFHLPDGKYGVGSRGVKYDTAVGQAVRAAATGSVSFAGAVAGTLHVTVDHGGGLLSSYSYLHRVGVREGDRVSRGQVVGVAGDVLHFGVRVDGEYVDPARFTARRRIVVRLISNRGAVRP